MSSDKFEWLEPLDQMNGVAFRMYDRSNDRVCQRTVAYSWILKRGRELAGPEPIERWYHRIWPGHEIYKARFNAWHSRRKALGFNAAADLARFTLTQALQHERDQDALSRTEPSKTIPEG